MGSHHRFDVRCGFRAQRGYSLEPPLPRLALLGNHEFTNTAHPQIMISSPNQRHASICEATARMYVASSLSTRRPQRAHIQIPFSGPIRCARVSFGLKHAGPSLLPRGDVRPDTHVADAPLTAGPGSWERHTLDSSKRDPPRRRVA